MGKFFYLSKIRQWSDYILDVSRSLTVLTVLGIEILLSKFLSFVRNNEIRVNEISSRQA